MLHFIAISNLNASFHYINNHFIWLGFALSTDFHLSILKKMEYNFLLPLILVSDTFRLIVGVSLSPLSLNIYLPDIIKSFISFFSIYFSLSLSFSFSFFIFSQFLFLILITSLSAITITENHEPNGLCSSPPGTSHCIGDGWELIVWRGVGHV